MLTMNTALRNHLINTVRAELLTDGTLELWAGPIPATPDSPTTGSTLLAEVEIGNLSSAAGGSIQDTDTPWVATGGAQASGVASFFRIVSGTYRIQGTVGITPSFDLQVGNTNFVAGADFEITQFTLAQGA